MDVYSLLKLLHVFGAVLWVGGATGLALLVTLLDRREDGAATLAALAQVAWAGARVFAPVGGATILSGLTLAWIGGWGWAPWILLSAALLVLTFLLNARVLGPLVERCLAARAKGEARAALALGRQALRLLRADLCLHAAVLSLMVLKPGWGDPVLLVPGVLLLGSGLSLYTGSRRAEAKLTP